jgi:hypothetical protein
MPHVPARGTARRPRRRPLARLRAAAPPVHGTGARDGHVAQARLCHTWQETERRLRAMLQQVAPWAHARMWNACAAAQLATGMCTT